MEMKKKIKTRREEGGRKKKDQVILNGLER